MQHNLAGKKKAGFVFEDSQIRIHGFSTSYLTLFTCPLETPANSAILENLAVLIT